MKPNRLSLPTASLLLLLGAGVCHSQVITPTGATSTSTIGSSGRTIDKVIDGSGLSGVGDLLEQTHSNLGNTTANYWLSVSGAPTSDPPEELTFTLPGPSTVGQVHAWQYDRNHSSWNNRGINTFDISFSTDNGATYPTTITGVTLARGPDDGANIEVQSVPFASQTDVTHIKFSNLANFGGQPYLGLAEVRFGGVSAPPPADSFALTITPNSPDSRFKLEWDSQAGMLYRVLSNTGLGTPIDTWSLLADDIAATPSTNSYNVDPVDSTLFYAVEEYPAPPPPPLLEENFDAAAALPVGWTINGPGNGTDWEVGTPSGVASGPTAANSAPNCAGTNISGYYTENADVSLVSPSIAIPSGSGASLSFRQFIDTDLAGSPHDVGSVRILDADNSDTPIAGLEILDIEGDGLAGWTEEMLDLPALDVGGKNIKVEFRFVSNAGAVPDLDVWGGFYADDVVVTQN